MNKKLFALLTSAALMAGFAPSVFAEEAASDLTGGVKLVPAVETAAAGDVVDFDVYVIGTAKITALQFTFKVDGGEIVEDVQQVHEDPDDEDSALIWQDLAFTWDDAGVSSMKWGDKGYIGGALEKKTEAELEAFKGAAKPYLLMGYDAGLVGKKVGDGVKIGTLKVKAGDGDKLTLSADNGLANYKGEDGSTLTANWTVTDGVVTIGAATTSSEAAPESSSEAAPASSSEAKPAVSSETTSTTSTATTSKTTSTTTTNKTSSTAKTNNTNDNKNTGAASTAAVALVGAAAALVVVSKKRK